MLNKFLVRALVVGTLLNVSLIASDYFVPNLNAELSHNKQLIKDYENSIKELKKRDLYLVSVKKKHPKLYESKPLYEDTKTKYIYRIKLNGAKAKDLNFTIKNHIVSIDMNIKITKNTKEGYYESSQSFYEEYSIPKNVKESKITHKIDGDYFVIIMPKK